MPLALLALLVGAGVAAPASGQEVVELEGAAAPPMPPDLLDQLVWTAGGLQRLLAGRDYPSLLVLSALRRVVSEGTGEAPEGVGPLLGALASGPGAPTRLQECRAAADPVEGALCSLEALVPLAPGPLAREMAEEGARIVALYRRPGTPTLGGAVAALARGTAPGQDPLQRFAEAALEGAWRLRSRAPEAPGEEEEGAEEGAAPSLDQLLAALTGFSPREGAEGILGRLPSLQSLLAQHPVLASPGEEIRATQAVLGEYHAFLGSLTGSLRQSLSPFRDKGGLEGFLAGSGEERARQGVDWAAQRSFVYLAARSAALAGAEQEVAERIRVVGSAAADLHRGASSFSGNLAALGQQAAVAALSGNVLAVAAGLTSFFGATPGALGTGAGAEVRALRQALDSLRSGLDEHHRELRLHFDALFGVLDSRFGRLEALVATGNEAVLGEVRSLHQEILGLGERMERMEENLYSYMQAGFDRDYNRTLVRCLEHRERFLPPFDQMEFSLFSECLGDFRTRAIRDARDALLTDQATLVDDLSVAAALADSSPHNLARRLPLLGRVAAERFNDYSLRGGWGLANPVEWAVASQAYLTMLQDWPEYARLVAPTDLEAIRSTGLEVREALQSLVVDPFDGRRGVLLERVLAYYDTRVADLTAEADILARRYQQEELLRVPAGAVLSRLEPWETGHPHLDVPPRIAAAIPQEIRTAAVLALGEASLVYRLALEDSVVRENFRRRLRIFGKRHDRLTFTRTEVEVELRFGDQGTLARHRVSGPLVHRRTEEMAGDERSEKVRSARELIPAPGVHFLAELWPALAADPQGWQLSAPRPSVLQGLERAIEEELRRHASVGLDNVFAEVCASDPGALRVEGADRESALRLRIALEGLTAARAFLQACVRLALPRSAEGDPRLREALFGTEGILDQAGLCAAFGAGENPLRMVWLEEEPRRRAASLAEALRAALGEDALPQPLILVEETLREIEAALRLQQLRALAARGGG